jgi:hypothetical protein
MRIKFMHRNAIDCEVLTGTERNKRILIPRINLTYCDDNNKSQKQTFEKIAIFLETASFQLYVAASRVRSFDGLRFYISEYNGQGHIANDEILF